MRLTIFLVLAACGGSSFAQVAAVLDYRERSSGAVMSAVATKKLNPACASNCELGAAFPDGGVNGVWLPLTDYDAGVEWGPPQEVAIGATVTLFVRGGGPSAIPSCDSTHEVPREGFTVTATVHADAGCDFAYR